METLTWKSWQGRVGLVEFHSLTAKQILHSLNKRKDPQSIVTGPNNSNVVTGRV